MATICTFLSILRKIGCAGMKRWVDEWGNTCKWFDWSHLKRILRSAFYECCDASFDHVLDGQLPKHGLQKGEKSEKRKKKRKKDKKASIISFLFQTFSIWSWSWVLISSSVCTNIRMGKSDQRITQQRIRATKTRLCCIHNRISKQHNFTHAHSTVTPQSLTCK